MGFHIAPVRMAVIQTCLRKRLVKIWGKKYPNALLVEMCTSITTKRQHSNPLDIWKRCIVPFIGTHPKEMKSAYKRIVSILMFIAVQFTIAKTWNQHRYPSTDAWVRKIGYNTWWHTAQLQKWMLYFTIKWMQLDTIILK